MQISNNILCFGMAPQPPIKPEEGKYFGDFLRRAREDPNSLPLDRYTPAKIGTDESANTATRNSLSSGSDDSVSQAPLHSKRSNELALRRMFEETRIEDLM